MVILEEEMGGVSLVTVILKVLYPHVVMIMVDVSVCQASLVTDVINVNQDML